MTTFLESQIVERFRGSQLVKPAVRVCADTNITLSGEQTIQSVALLDGDSVALKGQTDTKQNGIWTCHAGGWTRRDDADALGDLQPGTMVYVEAGTFAGALLVLTTEAPIYPGQTAQTWIIYNVATALGLGADKAVTTSGAGALQGTTIANGEVLGRSGGAFLGVSYGPTVSAGRLAAWDTGGVLRATVLEAGSGPMATVGEVRGGQTVQLVGKDSTSVDRIFAEWAGGLSTGSVKIGTSAIALARVDAVSATLQGVDSTFVGNTTGGSGLSMSDDGAVDLTAGGDMTLVGDTLVCTTTGTIVCAGGAASQFSCTAGNLTIAANSDTTAAIVSAGTSGNKCSVEIDANADTIALKVNTTTCASVTATDVNCNVPLLQFGRSVANPTVQQAAPASDVAPGAVVYKGQNAYGSATVNTVGGATIIEGGDPTTGGTHLRGKVRINHGQLVSGNSQYTEFESGTVASPTVFARIRDDAASGALLESQNTRGLTLSGAVDIRLFGGSTGTGYWDVGTGTRNVHFRHNSTTISLSVELTGSATTLEFAKDQTSTIKVATPTSDVAPKGLTLTPGQPFGSASTNTTPAPITKELGAPVGSGTIFGSEVSNFGANLTKDETARRITLASTSPTNLYSDTAVPQSATTQYEANIVCWASGRAFEARRKVGVSRDGASAPVIHTNQDIESEQRIGNDNPTIAYAVLWKVSGNNIVLEVTAPDATSTTVGCFVERRIVR